MMRGRKEQKEQKELKVKRGKRVVKVEYVANGDVDIKQFPLEGLGQNEEFPQYPSETMKLGE